MPLYPLSSLAFGSLTKSLASLVPMDTLLSQLRHLNLTANVAFLQANPGYTEALQAVIARSFLPAGNDEMDHDAMDVLDLPPETLPSYDEEFDAELE